MSENSALMRVQHIHYAFVNLVCLPVKVLFANRNHPCCRLNKGLFGHQSPETLTSDGAAPGARSGLGALAKPQHGPLPRVVFRVENKPCFSLKAQVWNCSGVVACCWQVIASKDPCTLDRSSPMFSTQPHGIVPA